MRVLPSAVVLAIIVGLATPAAASPEAEALFLEGRDLIAAGKIDAACDRFQRSQDLEAKVGTLLNLGDCREKQGQLANAWGAFSDAKALAIRTHDDRAAEAEHRATAIYPRLAHLTITVTAAPGLTITRGGAPVPPAAWNTSIPVDPGSHVIEARAPGSRPWSTTVTLAVGGTGTATVPALERDPDAPVPGTGPVVPSPIPSSLLGRIGFGIAFGATSDSDIIGGLRFVAGYPVPDGGIRGTLQVLYTRIYGDNFFAFGFGADYLRTWGRGFASGGGFGFGLDLITYDDGSSDRHNWFAFRVTPLVLRVAKPKVEVGLHLQFVLPAKVLVGVIGVDLFVF